MRDQGGLLVLGTSFHESQRSENQLKGRAARQGDPGETLMMYDLDDAAFKGAGQVSINVLYSEFPTVWPESPLHDPAFFGVSRQAQIFVLSCESATAWRIFVTRDVCQ